MLYPKSSNYVPTETNIHSFTFTSVPRKSADASCSLAWDSFASPDSIDSGAFARSSNDIASREAAQLKARDCHAMSSHVTCVVLLQNALSNERERRERERTTVRRQWQGAYATVYSRFRKYYQYISVATISSSQSTFEHTPPKLPTRTQRARARGTPACRPVRHRPRRGAASSRPGSPRPPRRRPGGRSWLA